MGKKRTREQRDADIDAWRETTRRILPLVSDEKKSEFEAERKKHEDFDKEQEDKRGEPFWRKFAKEKGIEPENLTIGPVPDENEIDKKHIALKKIQNSELEKAEPILNIIRHDDGKITLTINTQYPRELIKHELDKVLGPAPAKRFSAKKLRDLEAYRLRCIGKTHEFRVFDRYGRATGEHRTTVKKKTFVEIGVELGIKEDAARMSFNRVYELIRGTPYRRVNKKKIEKALLGKDCNTCKKRPSCTKLCPGVLAYAEQDKG